MQTKLGNNFDSKKSISRLNILRKVTNHPDRKDQNKLDSLVVLIFQEFYNQQFAKPKQTIQLKPKYPS